MHHIYTTDSIILKREPQDTSAYYYILTRDLGLIKARAQGVRKSESRLKGALQEFSLSTIAHVHTKAGWKITTAIPEKNFFTEAHSTVIRQIMAKISDCLIRLITGEEKNVDIFTVVEKGFTALTTQEGNAPLIEVIILARILYILGLLVQDAHTTALVQDFSDFSEPILSHTRIHKVLIIRAINQGFKESQL
jgi:recombinational DNA repair protein (RecF pathway)